ncbi:MAG: MogA/MoaB family molybdenum cofactor biosynthesis protein [Thermoplasmata archaeon]|nr:MogA/MoaB family molybdenum cofactor biosynthesis protein [Thermoplasmata archaeon]MCI4362437.1 MogA/MoaB family molybdenum cofactor biosynthesis protein [Thermoplasmata archaeon]
MSDPTSPPTSGRHHLGGTRAIRFGILSVSDTHTEDDDVSGELAKTLLTASGHPVAAYHLVANSVADVRDALQPWLDGRDVEAILTIGGTGASSRDLTVNALETMGGRVLPGFGELYRSLSFAEVGPLALLSRATLFVVKLKPVFALPGSERAVRTALERLVVPSVQHLVEELER